MLVYIVGFFTGIISGMAIGGGTLLVPALVIFMNVSQHTAQGVCLASFIPTAVVAVITHYRMGNVNIRLALCLTVGALAGAVLGAFLANVFEPGTLRKFFGFFLIVMGLYQYFGKAHVKNDKSY